MLKRIILVLISVVFISGCSGKDKSIDAKSVKENVPQTSVEELYTKASNALDAGKLEPASKLFDEVERQYPYSKWANKSQVMSAYAHYKGLKYDEAILALDRFIQLHPGDDNIDYAYYLRGLSYYEQISDVRRDQKMTEFALRNLEEVVKRFPDTEYARDSKLKMDLTLDHLAGKEMEIGRFYLNNGHIQAGLRRFKTVVEKYETTTQVPEALYRIVEAYMVLGIETEASRTAAILGHNFPSSDWYKKAYGLLKGEPVEQVKKSLIDRVFKD